jgi:hypothetical protein
MEAEVLWDGTMGVDKAQGIDRPTSQVGVFELRDKLVELSDRQLLIQDMLGNELRGLLKTAYAQELVPEQQQVSAIHMRAPTCRAL